MRTSAAALAVLGAALAGCGGGGGASPAPAGPPGASPPFLEVADVQGIVARAAEDKVTSNCLLCHGFHDSRHPWDPGFVPKGSRIAVAPDAH